MGGEGGDDGDGGVTLDYDVDGPHQDQPLATAGTDLEDATAAVVLTHGRGATAQSMLQLAREVHHDGVVFLAPQAARRTWYPNSFLAPVEQNEPGRTSGLRAIADAVGRATDSGIPLERVAFVGFSQGACLASEFVGRNPRRYGGLAALSGGLIGDSVDPEDYLDDGADLEGTPVFLGCSDVDPHIPEERVHETADVLEAMNGDVTERLYEGMGHGVNEDELAFVSELVAALVD
ncbi:alpha/beta hydrolase [Natronolimnohabitans innermongolicus]|uniref:Phospholipase/carboxylesterase n=1 Tax=Natronolimnohabitans innermongolicus JCM 12255 TaxID=1227499 RepID=L9X5I9_9EURY|nr:dienelactone hydrolase family protein [Natronolimnohabitans innermongolicus]ELY55858.1 phospholipase/carboxylesterase [Natronolimnohabitans innermongolicus JCM 12255]